MEKHTKCCCTGLVIQMKSEVLSFFFFLLNSHICELRPHPIQAGCKLKFSSLQLDFSEILSVSHLRRDERYGEMQGPQGGNV